MTGAQIFRLSTLNIILNEFVKRLTPKEDAQALKFDQVITSCELLLNFNKQLMIKQASQESPVEIENLVKVVNERYMTEYLEKEKMSTYELTCLYWLYSNSGSHW